MTKLEDLKAAGGLVWMAILRRGNAFHEPAGRKTVCGRFLGDPETVAYPARGAFLTADDAVAQYGGEECRMCFHPDDKVDPMAGGWAA